MAAAAPAVLPGAGAAVCAPIPAAPSPKRPRSDSGDLDANSAFSFPLFKHAATEPAPAPAAAPAAATGSKAEVEATYLNKALRSVVKIFCTMAKQMFAQTKSTASGFVVAPIASRRILTNAHAVSNAVQVMLRKNGSARKFSARVLAVGHECDVAMLTVDDDAVGEGAGPGAGAEGRGVRFWTDDVEALEFWTDDVEALEVGGLPAMQSSVTVVGFPLGGDNVCVTKGVVSRLDRQQYSHGKCALLTSQTDAPINSGNSGGPVLMEDKAVGLAFQSLTGAENTGYVIPTPVVQHFLTDLERHGGKYTGFPELGITFQSLESADMKRSLGMPAEASGIYVTGCEPTYHASQVLRAGDVITAVQGHPIADDGTFQYPEQAVRIDFRHLASMAYDGDSVKVGIWRDGSAAEVEVRVSVPRHLVAPHSFDHKPKYFIFGGLVFTRLTQFYLRHQYGADWWRQAPIKLCDRVNSAVLEAPGQEVVILSKVLSSEVNYGYQELGNVQVHKVNGVKIHNLAHLARMVTACTTEYVRFDLEWKRVVVLHTATARAALADILSTNAIPVAHSEGLLQMDLMLPADLAPPTSPIKPDSGDAEVADEEDDAMAVGQSRPEGQGTRDVEVAEDGEEGAAARQSKQCRL
ncbi:hypothetical protein GPECTOR_69g421 [Gonium pectorale]|uniref:Protease Do-like PDZ domain-containing protein n=1 Tax=Gonium pectorale TaxID=33097 RepID=A0A150G3A7_GONPE|nr:hypothetical protein GPECTOR_69g421 [Gonium pectorale]|eukprot:KXZ44328.1 hypothetical protein GPECTOR_69g421 [Gonium pectorale]